MVGAAPLISAIGAVSRNGAIGLDGWLPWDIPEELSYFERTVAGAALLIGRVTYESMETLPGPAFIVTTRTGYEVRPGCLAVPSVVAGLRAAKATGRPVFVIGGAALYAAAWPYVDRFLLTRIDADFVGDSVFPSDIPVHCWPVASERALWLPELTRKNAVLCRFFDYRNPEPIAIP